jgi:hypothetical protein
MAGHASLTGCHIHDAELDAPAAADALADAVLTRRMTSLELWGCDFSPAIAPALARLLGGGWLTQLLIGGAQLLDAPATTLLSNVLRLNSTLTGLTLQSVDMWCDPAAATALLGALTGHPSLRQLTLNGNDVAAEHHAAAGTALGALVAANAPALQVLDVSYCDLGDDGLGPLVDALASNTHLCRLECEASNISLAFARNQLLRAVITNTSLRSLRLQDHNVNENDLDDEDEAAWEEGVALLRKLEDAVAARFTAPAGN